MPNPKTSEPDLNYGEKIAIADLHRFVRALDAEKWPNYAPQDSCFPAGHYRIFAKLLSRLLAAEAERDRLRGALLGRIREENDCRPELERRPDCNGWDAEKCGCALEARLSDTLGGEKEDLPGPSSRASGAHDGASIAPPNPHGDHRP